MVEEGGSGRSVAWVGIVATAIVVALFQFPLSGDTVGPIGEVSAVGTEGGEDGGHFIGSPAARAEQEGEMAAKNTVQRLVGAVVGGIVADAASMPCHWVYDVGQLKTAVGEKSPEFLEPRANQFYKRETGDSSCYGDQALVLLRSLNASAKGEECFEAKAYASLALATFGAKEGIYSFYLENDVGRDMLPIDGAWMHGSVKQFVLAAREQNADLLSSASEKDEQVDGCVKVAPLVAALKARGVGSDSVLRSVEAMVKVTQAAEVPVAFAVNLARILDRVIDGKEVADACREVYDVLGDASRVVSLPADDQVRTELRHVIDNLSNSHSEYVAGNGRSCGLPIAWKNGLHAAAHHLSPELSLPSPFVARIRAAIMEGGCNCSRASIAGMLLGARLGVEGVPQEWVQQASNGADALRLAEALLTV